MSVTATKKETLRSVLNDANPNEVADALKRIKLGQILCPVKVTFASLASAAAQDITTAAAKAAATIVPSDFIGTGETLPAILAVRSLRVTAGAAAAGARFVTDTGGTPSTTVATLSDDGKTLTFEAAVTGFVLQYIPRTRESLESDFATTV